MFSLKSLCGWQTPSLLPGRLFSQPASVTRPTGLSTVHGAKKQPAFVAAKAAAAPPVLTYDGGPKAESANARNFASRVAACLQPKALLRSRTHASGARLSAAGIMSADLRLSEIAEDKVDSLLSLHAQDSLSHKSAGERFEARLMLRQLVAHTTDIEPKHLGYAALMRQRRYLYDFDTAWLRQSASSKQEDQDYSASQTSQELESIAQYSPSRTARRMAQELLARQATKQPSSVGLAEDDPLLERQKSWLKGLLHGSPVHGKVREVDASFLKLHKVPCADRVTHVTVPRGRTYFVSPPVSRGGFKDFCVGIDDSGKTCGVLRFDPSVTQATVREELEQMLRYANKFEVFDTALCEGQWTAFVTLMDASDAERACTQLGGEAWPAFVNFILAQSARQTAQLHEKGIIHGDLKMPNVLCSTSGNVTLADLGHARARDARGALTNRVGGTYLSPEMFFGSALEPGSDTYAFAAGFGDLIMDARYNPNLYLRDEADGSLDCDATEERLALQGMWQASLFDTEGHLRPNRIKANGTDLGAYYYRVKTHSPVVTAMMVGFGLERNPKLRLTISQIATFCELLCEIDAAAGLDGKKILQGMRPDYGIAQWSDYLRDIRRAYRDLCRRGQRAA